MAFKPSLSPPCDAWKLQLIYTFGRVEFVSAKLEGIFFLRVCRRINFNRVAPGFGELDGEVTETAYADYAHGCVGGKVGGFQGLVDGNLSKLLIKPILLN